MMPQKIAPQKNTPPPSTALFTVRADRISRALKIPRELLSKLADKVLTRGLHWEMVNKHPTLSPEGVALLRAAATATAIAPAPETPRRPVAGLLCAPRPPVTFKGELTAWCSPVKNERLLIAYIPGDDPTNPTALVNVQVRSNRNFLKGMTVLRARWISGITYEVSGAMPRWRGKY